MYNTPPDDKFLEKVLKNKAELWEVRAYLSAVELQLRCDPDNQNLHQHFLAVQDYLSDDRNTADDVDWFAPPIAPPAKSDRPSKKQPIAVAVGAKAVLTAEQVEVKLERLISQMGKAEINRAELQIALKHLSEDADLHPATVLGLYRQKQEEFLGDRLDSLINSNLFGSNLELELLKIATESGRTKREIKELYQLRLTEAEKADNTDLNSEVARQIELVEQTLDIADYLPKGLAEPIKRVALLAEVSPAACLTALVCGISSMSRMQSRLMLMPETNYDVPSNLYGATVGEQGTNKSWAYKTFIERPLAVLQSETLAEHKKKKTELKELHRTWESLKEDERESKFPEGKPMEEKDLPTPLVYFFQKGSEAGLAEQFDAHSHKILMYTRDELRGVICAAKQAKEGKHEVSREAILEYYSGKTNTDLLKGGVVRYTLDCLLSIYGTIQPLPLRREMGTADEEDGLWSRFLFVIQRHQINETDDQSKYELGEMLTALYRKVDQLPTTQYRVDEAGRKYFKKQRLLLKNKVKAEANKAMAAFYAKADNKIGRIALNLHIIHETFNGNDPSEIVSKERLVQATKLLAFYCHQARLIIQEAEGEDQQLAIPLAAIIQKSKDLAQTDRQGWVKARDLQKAISCFKSMDADKIREMFLQLAEMGLGVTRGSGVRLEFQAPHATQSATTATNDL